MLKRNLLLILLVLPLSIFAQNVVLWGNVPEYSGETITFLTYSDQITFTEKVLCTTKVEPDGHFICEFETAETIYVFAHLGIYEAFIFVEPGKDYELLLPERKEKTIADELNPYFEPTKYHIGIENSSESELNYQLAYFDDVYTKMIDQNALLIFKKSKELNVDHEIEIIDSIFSRVDDPFFKEYKKYRLAAFKQLTYQEKAKSISNTYYLNREILYENPSYMELFNQVYDDYLSYFGRTESGKKIYTDIGEKKSITALKSTLGQDSILTNDSLKELVILKCLFDEFYKDRFSRSAMLRVLDSLSLQTKVQEHKDIAENIRNKVTKLMLGFNPPAFELYDKDSNLVTLDSFKGKYVYLGFCTTISYACIKEFEMLRNLYEQHKDHFEIVIICIDESLEQMKYFVERKNYPFTFLHYGNQPDVFKEYDIRAFPTYYFIDKTGKLSLSPAPSPGENVEFAIFKIMRANGDI